MGNLRRQIFTISGDFTWRQISQVLRDYHTEYGIRPSVEIGESPCGLAAKGVTYKIYSKYIPYSNCPEPQNAGTHSAHVCLHPNGVCFSGSLNIDKDWEFAKELWNKVRVYHHHKRQRRR